jgi:hypothetical protein
MIRGALRHPQFDKAVEKLSAKFPGIKEVIDGAIWSLCREPEDGKFIQRLGVWQARLIPPEAPPILLFYAVNKRFLTMLTAVLASRSK